MERDYEKLEGRVINVKTSGGPYFGRVIGCDPDIGITVVAVHNPNRYICCLIGPSAPNYPGRITPEKYRIFFDSIVKQIEDGCISLAKTEKVYRKISSGNNPGCDPSSKTCAFSQ